MRKILMVIVMAVILLSILLETQAELENTREELRKTKQELESQGVQGEGHWGLPTYEMEYDLTGRGEGRYTNKIRFYGKQSDNLYKIEVDELSIISRADNLSGVFELVKISEDQMIFAVGQEGPSNDDVTSYYYYDITGNIGFIDILPGRGEDITYHGDGTLTTKKRGSILQTWFYDADYSLNQFNRFELIPRDLYDMNTTVKVTHTLSLQQSRTNKKTVTTLQPGENAIILASDDIEWCLVRSEKGVEGWFAVDDFYHIRGTDLKANQVFEGLCYAD